jgi:multiple sugar transport system substrate-binding protein
MGQEEADRYIKAFEAAHPNIKVEKDPAVDWPWNEKLAAVAAAGELPDVLWTFGVPVAVTNGWLEDLTPYLETDPEFKEGKTFLNLNETAKYNGKQYALPHSLYMFAINLNLDLFEKENVPVPPVNWTVEDMREAAKALTKYNEQQFGLNNIKGMRETLPSSFNPNFDWNTWDGEKFNFTSSDFKRTVDYVDNLLYSDQVALDTAKPEEREQWYGKDKDPWILGKIGMQYDGTWSIPYNIENAKFKWDVRPLPAESSQRIPLIADYVGISKSSQHKEAAFEFVKWLTYSKEGWMARLQPDWPLSSIPLINDEEVWNLYLSNENMPEGMRELLNMISDGFVDPIKWLPGYIDALNIYGETFKLVEERKAKLEDIVADMEKRMNDAYNSAVEQLNNAN